MPDIIHDLEAVKAEAEEKIKEEDFKHAVEVQKMALRKKKAFRFSKKLKLQWPIKLVEHHVVYNRRRSDKGRTR